MKKQSYNKLALLFLLIILFSSCVTIPPKKFGLNQRQLSINPNHFDSETLRGNPTEGDIALLQNKFRSEFVDVKFRNEKISSGKYYKSILFSSEKIDNSFEIAWDKKGNMGINKIVTSKGQFEKIPVERFGRSNSTNFFMALKKIGQQFLITIDTISTGGHAVTSHNRDVECPETTTQNLTENEAKALKFIIEKKYIRGKKNVCIQEIVIKDKFTMKQNTIIKYEAVLLFPNGYRTECLNVKASNLNKKFSWNQFRQVSQGCNAYDYQLDPLGAPVHPGETKTISADAEI